MLASLAMGVAGVADDRRDVHPRIQARFPIDRRITEHPGCLRRNPMLPEHLLDVPRRGFAVSGRLFGPFGGNADARERVAAEARHRVPAPVVMVSSPLPAAMLSLPVPPMIVSFPSPPSMLSSPACPFRLSLPLPPRMVSL